ncbi:hypothetical protein HYDPIDRAFT_65612, partial [Hydnomerulius pinastri MD-312]
QKLKAHLVEPLLTIVIQNRLVAPTLLNSLALVSICNSSMTWISFVSLLSSTGFCTMFSNIRLSSDFACLLDALFHLHATNTCQPLHTEPLLRIYGGTMSASDRRLLSIMRLFEAEKHTSDSTFSARWSPTLDASATSVLEVVQNFNPIRMLRTCLAFPNWRRFGEEKDAKQGPADELMYDPLIMIVL